MSAFPLTLILIVTNSLLSCSQGFKNKSNRAQRYTEPKMIIQ